MNTMNLPLKVECDGVSVRVSDIDGIVILELAESLDKNEYHLSSDNARRIVACVNACAGYETNALECIVFGGSTLQQRFVDLGENLLRAEKQRDALIKTMKEISVVGIGEPYSAILASNCLANIRKQR